MSIAFLLKRKKYVVPGGSPGWDGPGQAAGQAAYAAAAPALRFLKGAAKCLSAVTCIAALDVHMLCRTLIILIISTFGSLAVNTDIAGGVASAVAVGIARPPAGKKALTACLITAAGMFSAHHDIPLGTQSFLVVHTVFHTTL